MSLSSSFFTILPVARSTLIFRMVFPTATSYLKTGRSSSSSRSTLRTFAPVPAAASASRRACASLIWLCAALDVLLAGFADGCVGVGVDGGVVAVALVLVFVAVAAPELDELAEFPPVQAAVKAAARRTGTSGRAGPGM